MFDELFGLRRIIRKLKKIDKLSRLDQSLLKSGKKEIHKIDALTAHTKTIRRLLEKTNNIFIGKIPYYEQDKDNEDSINKIAAGIKLVFTELEKIEEELILAEDYKTEEDKEAVNKWINELMQSYSTIITYAEIIEKTFKDLKEPEKKSKKIITKEQINEAQRTLNNGRVVTKARELKQIARACGYTLIEGANHTDVLDEGKNKITEIPGHTDINPETARKILKVMALGKFIGTKRA